MKAATTVIIGTNVEYGISIHAAREGGDMQAALNAAGYTDISIHAAREGGDAVRFNAAGRRGISIHAAREGGDEGIKSAASWLWEFQSTPPVKAATGCRLTHRCRLCISIHAAREGGDMLHLTAYRGCRYFNPRRP